jgi:aminopeptidase N
VQIDTFALPIEQYFLRSESTKVAGEFAHLPDMLQYFSRVYGVYPFIHEKYGHTGVTSGWAMENQTLTAYFMTLSGNTGYDWVIAHELAHQWWGDWVTLDNFSHIWLNEGFATYSEALYIGHRDSASNPAAYDAYIQNEMNFYLGTCQDYYGLKYWDYPIVPPVSLFSSCNTYTKGGLVLHILRGVLGDSLFFAGLRQYGQQFAYANAITQDFQNVMEGVSGQNLTWFFQEWVYSPGFPYYLYSWTSRGETLQVVIRQVQQDSISAQAPYFEMPIRLRLTRATLPDTVVVMRNHAVAVETLEVVVGDSVTALVFDDGNWILDKHMEVPTAVSEDRPIPQLHGLVRAALKEGLLEVVWEGPRARVPVRILDGLGRVRWSRSVNLHRGSQTFRIPGLPRGIYWIQAGVDRQRSLRP